jgi:hypothetical protein
MTQPPLSVAIGKLAPLNWNNALRHLRRVRFGRLFAPVIHVSPALGPGQRFSEAEDGGQVAEHGDGGGQCHAERGAVALGADE